MSAGGFGRNYDEVDVPPPWDDDDASPNHPAALASKHRGQVRMAYRLAAAYGDELMFVHGIGWHAWGRLPVERGPPRRSEAGCA